MNNNFFFTPRSWPDYELIDTGGFEKLERFGEYITIRPEPQAVWDKQLPPGEWEKRAHVKFIPKSSSAGTWEKLKAMPDQWQISYKTTGNTLLRFRLGLTSFKHVGIFPEQAVNWDYIAESTSIIREKTGTPPKVLNLFAYTGGASLAAKAAGATVTHLDSVKQVISWARENMELSQLDDIRWVIEDALKFVKREVKRGNTYNGIILDPPAYGHGPGGEKWKLEENINEMVQNVLLLLDPGNHFLILNAYSLGLSSVVIGNLLKNPTNLESGELLLQSTQGNRLPLGVFGRYRTHAGFNI